jgi:hypothetical protein
MLLGQRHVGGLDVGKKEFLVRKPLGKLIRGS